MFESGNGYAIAETRGPECKRDLEKEASYLKKRIDREKKWKDATVDLLQNGLDMSRDHKIILYAMVGDFAINIPEREANYDFLLAQIEKEASANK